MLFMKGTKIFPQCGFSNMAVQILNAIGADFETCDVLSDDFIRQQIKTYSDWPTIPQLYVDGEFVGGSDIMLEMYQAGELQEMMCGRHPDLYEIRPEGYASLRIEGGTISTRSLGEAPFGHGLDLTPGVLDLLGEEGLPSTT